jgi:glutamate synthase domain-containing protein 1
VCGIVGLFLKKKQWYPQLGSLTAQMITVLSARGPDSAGFAVYGSGDGNAVKLTLRVPDDVDLSAEFSTQFNRPANLTRHSNHVVLPIIPELKEDVRAWLKEKHPEIHIVGAGMQMELYKDVGRPEDVVNRFDLRHMSGSHAIGHTRMATESSVTTDGSHPFSTGMDQCLVHNGSLSNHNAVRRMLKYEGMNFETENDSEVAASFLTWRMREGAKLETALYDSLESLDGFYTFVVGTKNGFAVVRDPIACKPAIMVETSDYVAFGTEYRAIAVLPNVADGHLFEPDPGRVYAWEH